MVRACPYVVAAAPTQRITAAMNCLIRPPVGRKWRSSPFPHARGGPPHPRTIQSKRTFVHGPARAEPVTDVIGEPERGVFAFDDAVDGGAPGALSDTGGAPFLHVLHERGALSRRERPD